MVQAFMENQQQAANGMLCTTSTAAHNTHLFGTVVQVQSLSSGRNVTVRMNDRGPFARGRIIDLSYDAAKALGMIGKGTEPVRVIVVGLQ